jgi:hypothetical protein
MFNLRFPRYAVLNVGGFSVWTIRPKNAGCNCASWRQKSKIRRSSLSSYKRSIACSKKKNDASNPKGHPLQTHEPAKPNESKSQKQTAARYP